MNCGENVINPSWSKNEPSLMSLHFQNFQKFHIFFRISCHLVDDAPAKVSLNVQFTIDVYVNSNFNGFSRHLKCNTTDGETQTSNK